MHLALNGLMAPRASFKPALKLTRSMQSTALAVNMDKALLANLRKGSM